MYTFDASSIIHAWDNYPIEHFPPLWNWLSEQIADGHNSIPLVAMDEVNSKTPECHAWLKAQGITVLPLTNAILQQAARVKILLEIAEDNYHSKGVGENDLFIIATAKFAGLTLVSEEGRQFRLPEVKAKYKIPAVCSLQDVAVECINFIEFIKSSEAVFD
jgi:predicted nucleic acid-binding protein